MILVGDCRLILPTLAADSFDSIVTDPPYHLGRKGFMGQAWDGGDVAFRAETWAAALRVAKPGAHLVAFGGCRTHHRLMAAIEDGGWELRDVLMWVFGSGFPKSKNLAGDFDGWGSALKPAWEPIVLARKPFKGSLEANVARYGTGALNIAACRIEGENRPPVTGKGGIPCRNDIGTPRGREGEASANKRYDDRGGTTFTQTPGPRGGDPAGRWPANLIHDGHPDVVARFPVEAGAASPVRGTERSAVTGDVFGERERVPGAFHSDTGSAARFFYCAKASAEERDRGVEHFEQRPAGFVNDTGRGLSELDPNTRVLRGNFHPTVKPIALMRYLCRLVTPPGGHVLDLFAGSGSTGCGAAPEGFAFTGIELEEDHAEIARGRLQVAPLGLALGSV